MSFAKSSLKYDDMGLEVHLHLVYLQLGPSGATVLLKVSHLHDKDVHNPDDMAFSDCLSCLCCIVKSLVEPHV